MNMFIKRCFILAVCGFGVAAASPGSEGPAGASGSAIGSFVVVDDFEDGDSVNSLGGKSGPWTLNPGDKESFCDAKVVEVEGLEGETKCLSIKYSVDSEKNAQCGFWSKLNSLDATAYDHIQFDIKGDAAEGYTGEFQFELKRFKNAANQVDKLTGRKTIRDVTDSWQTMSIPLIRFSGLYDKTQSELRENPENALKYLDEYVIVFHKRGVTNKKGVIYIDNVKFVKTGESGPTVFDRPPENPKDKACIILEDNAYKKEFIIPAGTDSAKYDREPVAGLNDEEIISYLRSNPDTRLSMKKSGVEYLAYVGKDGKFGFLDHDNYMKFLANRLAGFPRTTVVKKTFPSNDREFLLEIAKDTWGFFDNIVDKQTGLPLDTIVLGEESPLGDGGVINDYTNVTNIGIYLCCVVAAHDLGFISKNDAVSRIKKTLGTLNSMEASEQGFYYNYYDTTWGTRTEYFISFVDSGWLSAGLYVAKNAFPREVGVLCSRILDKQDYSFFYDPIEQQMWHGYYENMEDYVDYHYGIFFAEPRLASFIAIGRGEVEEEHWFRMVRTFPEEYEWTTQRPKNRIEKEYNGIKYYGGYYEYKGVKFVPSWGGSMFEALMPGLLLAEKEESPQGLGLNCENHTKIAITYALEDLKYPVWGMSPSSDTEGGYGEYGVKVLGASGYRDGVVTPHATFLALEYEPLKAIKNLRAMLAGWDIYGEYGFYDALDPLSKDVAYRYLALDQGMALMALDNYLNDGALRRHFMKDQVYKNAQHLLKSEICFE